MSSLLLFLFLLYLSMHACHGRLLNVDSGRQAHLSRKDVEKARFHRTSIPLKVKPSISEDVQAQERAATGKSLINESPAGAKTQKPRDSELPMKEVEETKGRISGSEIIMSSSHVGLRHATKIEGSERRARSMLGSASHVSKEILDSKENGINEDVVAMDYEQPHRKPPIHNASP